MTRLLILDINGLLCCKLPKDETSDIEYEYEGECELLELNKYKVMMRPGVEEFLKFCYENFKVAFFSSTSYYNANAILEKLLTNEQKKATVFRWYRDRTHYDPESLMDENSFKTIKRLEDIFDNPIINMDRKYTKKNTILCDDSEIKNRFNDKNNMLIFETFMGKSDDTELYSMKQRILDKFECL